MDEKTSWHNQDVLHLNVRQWKEALNSQLISPHLQKLYRLSSVSGCGFDKQILSMLLRAY